MKKPYEIPEVELIVLRPNAAIAYLPGTDPDKDGITPYNNSGLGNGKLSFSGGGEEGDDRG